MVQNNRFETDGAAKASTSGEVLLADSLVQSRQVSPSAPEQSLPGAGGLDPAVTLAEAERWLAVIPPTAACHRLLELGILRRDVSLLEGLLSVLRNP